MVIAEGADGSSPQWGDPRRIADGWRGAKPVVLTSGEWLLPVFVLYAPSELAEENEYYRMGLTPCVVDLLSHDLGPLKGANVYGSADEGSSWSLLGQANRSPETQAEGMANLSEHHLVERRDGSLWMLIRMPRTAPGIGESMSSDGGRTWTPVGDSGVRHPSSRFFIQRLRSGQLLMVRHDPPEISYPPDCENCGQLNRSHLKAFLSVDDGRSWSGGLLLDERETVAYPDGTESDDGRVFIIYDRNRSSDREVWMAIFSEEDVRVGSCVTQTCQLRMPVSRPTR